MKRTVFILGLMVVAAAAEASESWSGTWRCGTGRNAAGELRTVERNGDVEFQLQLWGGPPAHNSGLAQGHMAIREGQAVFETTEFGGKCRIDFTFTPKRVVIKQTEGDWAACGFGHSIEAGGTFARTSRKPPPFKTF